MRKVGDRIMNKFGQQGTIRSIMNDDYFVKMNYQNENNDYKVFHGKQLKELRKAQIQARQEARGLTPGELTFNPVVKTRNNTTDYPLGPNSGPIRPTSRTYVPGIFSRLNKGYHGNYNESVEKKIGSLWQSPEEYRAIREAKRYPFAQNYENSVNPNEAKLRANKLHKEVTKVTPVPWYRRLFGSGTRKRKQNRKQKTQTQKKSRK